MLTFMDLAPRNEHASRLASPAVAAGDASAVAHGRAVWNTEDLAVAMQIYHPGSDRGEEESVIEMERRTA